MTGSAGDKTTRKAGGLGWDGTTPGVSSVPSQMSPHQNRAKKKRGEGPVDSERREDNILERCWVDRRWADLGGSSSSRSRAEPVNVGSRFRRTEGKEGLSVCRLQNTAQPVL